MTGSEQQLPTQLQTFLRQQFMADFPAVVGVQIRGLDVICRATDLAGIPTRWHGMLVQAHLGQPGRLLVGEIR